MENLKTKVIDEKSVEEMSSSLAQWDTLSKQEKKLILRQWIHVIWVDKKKDSDLLVEIVYQWDLSQTRPVTGSLPERSAG